MRRRLRRPGTQLARAGLRTLILRSDKPVPSVRFRAMVLQGQPAGRIEIERERNGHAVSEVLALDTEHLIDGADLVSISLIPERDTAITFLPTIERRSVLVFALGMVLVIGATVWTALDFIGG